MEFATVHHTLGFVAMFFEDDEFAFATVREFAEEAGLHDASIIQNEDVAWVKKLVEIAIVRVLDGTGLTIQDQKARSTTFLRWELSNALFGQIIVIVRH